MRIKRAVGGRQGERYQRELAVCVQEEKADAVARDQRAPWPGIVFYKRRSPPHTLP
jgi:hypothetical protein